MLMLGPGPGKDAYEVMRESDLPNAFDRQIGGKLDVGFGAKAVLEPDKRIDGRSG
jgi:hypothetical protein